MGRHISRNDDKIGAKMGCFFGKMHGPLPQSPANLQSSLIRQHPHDFEELFLPLKSDPGALGERHHAALDDRVVGKATEGAKHAWIGFSTAEPEARSNGKRHLIAAMRI